MLYGAKSTVVHLPVSAFERHKTYEAHITCNFCVYDCTAN